MTTIPAHNHLLKKQRLTFPYDSSFQNAFAFLKVFMIFEWSKPKMHLATIPCHKTSLEKGGPCGQFMPYREIRMPLHLPDLSTSDRLSKMLLIQRSALTFSSWKDSIGDWWFAGKRTRSVPRLNWNLRDGNRQQAAK